MCVFSVEGLIDVNMTEIPMEETELKFTKFFGVEFGGHWKPKDCIPHWKVRLRSPGEAVWGRFLRPPVLQVAILIPFRNRHEHLPILFQHLIPMLQRQRLQFAFYVIEQVAFGEEKQNSKNQKKKLQRSCLCWGKRGRAALFVLPCRLEREPALQQSHAVQRGLPGGHEGLELGLLDLPRRGPHPGKRPQLLRLRADASPLCCQTGQIHVHVGSPRRAETSVCWVLIRGFLSFVCAFSLPYNEFFGGVSGLTVEQFRKINGFPNAFWGWGGEDDDLWNRWVPLHTCPVLPSSRQSNLWAGLPYLVALVVAVTTVVSARVHYAGLNVTRPEGEIGKYKSIPHHHRGEVQFLGR